MHEVTLILYLCVLYGVPLACAIVACDWLQSAFRYRYFRLTWVQVQLFWMSWPKVMTLA